MQAADAEKVDELVADGVGGQVEPIEHLALGAQRVVGRTAARVLVLRVVRVVVQAGQDQAPAAVPATRLGAGVRRSVQNARFPRNHDQPVKVSSLGGVNAA